MAKPTTRIVALQLALGAGLLLVVARAGWLQLVKGRELARKAEHQRTAQRELEARRGTIYDRDRIPLVVSLPKFRVKLALNEVRDTVRLIRLAVTQLRIPADSLRRSFRRGTPRYPYFYGPFSGSQVAELRKLRGVYLETTYSRTYPNGILAEPIVGTLAPDGRHGASGLERSLDSLLAGSPGLTTDLRDPSGKLFESPGRLVREPVAGNDVLLTLEAELQAIAEFSLANALKAFKAEGGDVVFLDPRTGELLALASLVSSGQAVTPSALTSPFEPGSTAKPFTAAALLTLGRVGPAETVSGENGKWTFLTVGRATRTITDAHAAQGDFTLARAIQKSSNIAMAKFALKLRSEEQYEMLRAFGFGAPTGVEFPSEASGILFKPQRWRFGYDAQSLAMGYEMLVTPLQLAAAYGALANDGLLLAPTLVKEIRTPGGETLYRHEPELVRRVITPEVAKTIRGFLEEAASDSGTGGRAQVRGGILGKTGTALISERGRYVQGAYRASFAAIYPAQNPQLVAVVTIEHPHGAYYGGLTAAPLTAEMLRQALAARKSAIERSVATDERVIARQGPGGPPERVAAAEATASAVTLPLPPAARRSPVSVMVPDVFGRPVRAAVFALHQRGLRVRVEGNGRALRTVPAAGDSLPAGRLVVLYAAAERRTP
ncbi:MAG TPA: penicillin-binding transpeptidase domain-containing protein [Gemmatimonadales bacterium]|nr:penicillin-binding transpeptidase domain-containing protein [Gemmatimonadales bacterium]